MNKPTKERLYDLYGVFVEDVTGITQEAILSVAEKLLEERKAQSVELMRDNALQLVFCKFA